MTIQNDKTTNTETAAATADLRQAWDDLIEKLQNARDVIDSPDKFAPPQLLVC